MWYIGTDSDDILSGADAFLEAGTDDIVEEDLKDLSDIIYNILLAIALSLAVIVGMILGIKYLLAGSEEKAQIKETLTAYVISCIVIFGAFGIWKFVVSIFNYSI